MKKKAFHGGAFFNAIGNDFSTLDKSKKIINADVLDAWFDPSPRVIKKIRKYLSYAIKTSPPTHCEGLIKTISKYRRIPEKNIIVNGGSSDLMFSFFPRVLKKSDKVIILDPMYGEYAHIFENVVEAKLILCKLSKKDSFTIDFDSLLQLVKKNNPSMVVLVNPNSPTGQYWDKKYLLKLLNSVSSQTIIVVDETYIEYVDKNKSLEREAAKRKNLVVIKSMSKVYALSGARVGYLVAHESVIDKISPFIPPWSVSLLGQIAGVEALKDEKYYQGKYKETHRLRNKMIKSLQDIPSIEVFNSVASFFLVRLKDRRYSAKKIIEKLKKKNIFLRNCDSMSSQFKDNFIRFAVKDEKTNKVIIKAFKREL